MKKIMVATALLLAVPAPAYAYHDQGRCYDDGYCDGGGSDNNRGYDGGQGDNENSRRRNRGAFSPGPFDRSPIDFSNSCISLDCSGREKNRDDRKQPGPSQP